MKYDSLTSEVKAVLSQSKNLLIILPKELTTDHLASGLALQLALEQSGKTAYVVTEDLVKVEHTNLFGISKVQNQFPQLGGNFHITLGGVVGVDDQGKAIVPALENLEWHPVGSDLNLVFKVAPGKKFEPTHITPSRENNNFEVIFCIGVSSLESLGELYQNQLEMFARSHVVKIDRFSNNTQYGKTNLVDSRASSLSEIIAYLLPSLELFADADIASNLLAGIFSATDNLQSSNLTADTFEAMAMCLRSGGKKPSQPQNDNFATAAPLSPAPAVDQISSFPPGTNLAQGFDLNKLFNPNLYTAPVSLNNNNLPSPEEVPDEEKAVAPEMDWLTPKIYKGSSIG